MMVAASLSLFALAAVAEIGGAWLVWQGVREDRGWSRTASARTGTTWWARSCAWSVSL